MDASRPLIVVFAGGGNGSWTVERMTTVKGGALKSVERVAVLEGWDSLAPYASDWVLKGVTGGDHYVTDRERQALQAREAPLGRPEASAAAMIPIRKSADWWRLSQHERRAIFEDRSHHVASTLPYCRESHGVFITAGTSASNSISSLGSSSPPLMRPPSTSSSRCCARPRNGLISSARSISG